MSWRCPWNTDDVMTDLNIIRADVDFSLLAPSCALVDNHPLLRPLELVGESYGEPADIRILTTRKSPRWRPEPAARPSEDGQFFFYFIFFFFQIPRQFVLLSYWIAIPFCEYDDCLMSGVWGLSVNYNITFHIKNHSMIQQSDWSSTLIMEI